MACLLTPCPRRRRLLAGVADALARRYLRKVFFGFSRDKEGKDLLEEVRLGAGYWLGAREEFCCCGCWRMVGAA